MSNNNDRYDGVEPSVVHKEVADLNNLWNAYVDLTSNGSISVGIHPPPAFTSMYIAVLGIARPFDEIIQLLDESEAAGEAVSTMMWQVVAFGDAMLRFGQWCVSQGVLHANAAQCQCGTVDDAALMKWLAGPTGGPSA